MCVLSYPIPRPEKYWMGIGSRVCINFEWMDRALAIVSSSHAFARSLARPPRIGVQNVTSGRRPLSRRMFLVGLASCRRMWTDVIARVHTFRGSTRMLCETNARHRNHLAGFHLSVLFESYKRKLIRSFGFDPTSNKLVRVSSAISDQF